TSTSGPHAVLAVETTVWKPRVRLLAPIATTRPTLDTGRVYLAARGDCSDDSRHVHPHADCSDPDARGRRRARGRARLEHAHRRAAMPLEMGRERHARLGQPR